MKTMLLIIDPQNDFVDPKGSLYIPGAEKGIDGICKFIEEKNPTSILVTQDTHRSYHIGHPSWWKETPAPFTKITKKDIDEGKYTPVFENIEYVKDYFSKLPENTHHTIWPEHCLEGSWGHNIPEKLIKTLDTWATQVEEINELLKRKKEYTIIPKGTDPNCEMFSVFSKAHMPNENGLGLFSTLECFDKIYISGFAKDVCVAWSVRDMIKSGLFKDKLVFLNSCMTGLDENSDMLSVYSDAVKNYGAVWEE